MSQERLNSNTTESLNSSSQNSYHDSWSQDMADQCNRHGRYLGTVVIADAAKRAGALITWHGSHTAVAEIGSQRILIVGPAGTESALSEAISTDKFLTKELLADSGVPTPAGRLVDSAEDTVLAQREIGQTVVVKPRLGVMGRGVTVNIDGDEDLRAAYDRAKGSGGGVLVEEYVEGAEYRGHGSPTECVAVFQRLLPSVTGNGRDTVADLVSAKNDVRKLNPNTMTNPIKLDDVADGFLARQGLDRSAIVPDGQNVVVRDVNGITSGGDSLGCLEEAPESVRTVTSGAIAAIPGMSWAGTDLIVREGTGEAFVMEVNSYASISGPMFPVYGTPRDVAADVWKRIHDSAVPEPERRPVALKNLDQSRQVSSLAGQDGTTGLVGLLQYLLTRRGYEIQKQGRSVYTASRDSETLWFAQCLTAADLARPHRALQRQRTLRRILRSAEIPQVPGRRVTDVDHLKSFVRDRDEMTLMIPGNGRFDHTNVRLLPARAQVTEASLAGKRSWLVQEYPAGHRYTVIASRSGALAVIGRRVAEAPVEAEVFYRIAERAVDAVRAVPELRWSAVQLVVPQMETEGDVLVEGMTADPIFSPGDYLLAGSLEDFTDLVLEGADSLR